MTLVLLAAFIACVVLCAGVRGMRDAGLRGAVLFGVSLVAITEVLSAVHCLRRGPLFSVWLMLLLAAAWRAGKRDHRAIRIGGLSWLSLDSLIVVGIAGVSGVTLITALASPPNSADAMSYHMPRVVYWAQAGSVSFFPTSYFAQISLPPLSEYFVLHTYLLSGSDRFANLPQWLGSLGCAIGVSLIAQLFGAKARGQLAAALFCVTLPNGILQASSAKNDYLLAFWLVAMCYFAIRYAQGFERRDLIGAAGALGLAVLTKATAYLFAPAMLLGILLPRRRLMRAVPALAAGVLAINAPHYWRNMEFSHSPLGYDSAQGDGFFRWRNETFGWRQTVSNLLRNTSEQLGARSPEWNRGVYDLVARAHERLGIGLNDPATTWPWTAFSAPRNSNHEADANNRWHLLLLLMAAAYVAWKRREWLVYSLAPALGFLLFCFYLKWQPFYARMLLPLFVLGAPMAGLALEKLRPSVLQAVVCLFLLNNARPYLFENWVRPWKGPNSIWTTARDRQYFNDMNQWDNRASFEQAVAAVAGSGCETVGIDISHFHIEYPFQVLLRERRPGVRFVHTDVDSRTSFPCAVLCMDCAGVKASTDRYAAFGPSVQIGRFLLFTK